MERNNASKATKSPVSPKLPSRTVYKDPSLPTTVPTIATTSRNISATIPNEPEDHEANKKKKCLNYVYDREAKAFCGRTCISWLQIIVYALLYMIFLSTYTLIFLYAALSLVNVDDINASKMLLLTYANNGVGLSGTPTSENEYSLIWYKEGDSDQYSQYVNAIEKLLSKKRVKRDLTSVVDDLGPCGQYPYGYGEAPCVIIRVNRLTNWVGVPLQNDSSFLDNAPDEIKDWVKKDQKLWLHCDGLDNYDKEHIGKIKYYPHPPGYDPKKFPLDHNKMSPLLAVQFSDFTLGLSLVVRCEMWYENVTSRIDFLLYVAPRDK